MLNFSEYVEIRVIQKIDLNLNFSEIHLPGSLRYLNGNVAACCSTARRFY